MAEDILFSPFQLKRFNVKNRLGVAPMTRMSSVKDSIPRRDVLDFLVARAKNGAGIVYTEAIVTDYESAQGYPGQARLTSQRQIDVWSRVVENIHRHGALSILQMFHCGRVAWSGVNPAGRVIAPSAICPRQDNPLTGEPYPTPDVMSRFDIDHVLNGFVETAKGAVAAGFDGIEIHGAHGYLISQFLSGYTNQRTDGYGGSMEKRYRFVHEVIQAVRPVVPSDRLLFFRISNWGVVDKEISLFSDQAEYQDIIRRLSQEPIDAVSVSTYAYGDEAFGSGKTMARLTREATTLPIFICGKIYDRRSAEEALKDADIVLSGKTALLNPDWVDDLRTGKTLPLRSAEEADIAYTTKPLP
ncbi:NADH:flavin oxidoreductase/NADH oxidase [Desulfococcus multivorans]|uniref:NADH:flavin oxidoreductase/NADH oxidase n=1 Tax=Desulfococcus multivorans DSM 2059 TaxID=1121405 RepID=S7V9M9_DESML|nr:NADH:flavin oxidoreductase/NADH oxidase [Desulfococcus multivorans]AOY59584.1 NamA: NADPH dehydrogenase (xenobiotic reductase) [Desulfococcus multivorans]AQV01774.1 NADH-dependent flavin oxidoreductase [Desulfococcus multivorans]EPR41203.1 NADH:flavin oxidoreductase/NADH oxidase [Desulfococcus multivorans DSM 2059]SKA25393.1 2,4-dienoyl-CoA reductase [Desulfococcus multivorans DSM 2059]